MTGKFRVWDKEEKEYVDNRDNFFIDSSGMLNVLVGQCNFYRDISRNRFVVEFYIHIDDITGRGIYEGDIVRNRGEDTIIKHKKYKESSGSSFGMPYEKIFSGYNISAVGNLSTLEVVGNIHEGEVTQ